MMDAIAWGVFTAAGYILFEVVTARRNFQLHETLDVAVVGGVLVGVLGFIVGMV